MSHRSVGIFAIPGLLGTLMPEGWEPERLRRYASAVAVASIVLLSREALVPWLGWRVAVALSLVGVFFSAWRGGTGPGFLTLGIVATAEILLHLPLDGVLGRFVMRWFRLILLIAGVLGVWVIGGRIDRSGRKRRRGTRADRGWSDWLQALPTSLSDARISTDAEGLILAMNPLAAALTGWAPAEARGRPVSEVLIASEGGSDGPASLLARALAGRGSSLRVKTATRGPERPSRALSVQALDIPGQDGSLAGALLVLSERGPEPASGSYRRYSDEIFQSLVNGVDQFIWTTTPDGDLEYCNHYGLEYAGFTFETMRASWSSLIHPDDLSGFLERREKGRACHEKYEFDYRIRRSSDGSYRWHVGKVWPVFGENGQTIRWLGTSMDIEERRNLLESLKAGEERLRFALEAGGMGTWDWEIDTGVVNWSPTLESIHGLDPGTFPGRFEAFASDMHAEDRDRVFATIQRSLGTGDSYEVKYRIFRPDGTLRWVEARGKSLRDPRGKPYRMTGVCTDVTDRVQAEEELRRALHLAEEAGRARDRFLAMLSHELRTPLTPVVLASEEMLEDPELPPRFRESVAMIRRNVGLEVRLIEDLLDVSRVIRGKMNFRFEPVSGHELVRQVLEICRQDAEAKQLCLVSSLGATHDALQADPARIQQILWNLLKNAVKFTPSRGAVRISTRFENSEFVVEVTDTGPGIEPSDLGRIFRPFEQIEGEGCRNDGLGLGLTISRSIAEAHGGTLEAAGGGEGQGASFTLRLPTRPHVAPRDTQPAADHDRWSSAPKPPGQGLRVLLVEDEPMTSRVMQRMLRRHGHEVHAASTLAEALSFATEEVDVVVSDIRLPDGDGLELMRRLRESTDVPGIALTGFGTEDDRGRSKEAGFVDHIIKPVDFARLEEAIRRVARPPRPKLGQESTAKEPSLLATPTPTEP